MHELQGDYYFVVRQYNLDEVVNGKVYQQEVCGIGLYDPKKDIIYPLPITKFLMSFRNRNGSLSSQKNAAETVKRFLNYCRENARNNNINFEDIKKVGLQGLKLEHGSHYITYLSQRSRHEGLSPDYVRSEIQYLNQFYYYLQEEKIIEKQFEIVYREKEINVRGIKKKEKVYTVIDIFKKSSLQTVYPPPKAKKGINKLKDFGKDRYILVKEFIDTAEIIAPDIVIGLYFQFFGGLRRGEVVNLIRDALMETDDGYVLDIEDRREDLFPNKKNTEKEQVKVPRYQGLLWHKQMSYAIEKHIKWLNSLKKKGVLINPNALLVNANTMKPITGANYEDKFNKVKETYLKKLSEEGRLEHFLFLNVKPWSTHIGRGCFTNFCLDIGMEIGEVAVARSDSNINSVLDYIEEKVAVQTLRDAMNHISKAYEELEDKSKIASSIQPEKREKWNNEYERKRY